MYIFLKYSVDSLANRWNYTVGDNHRVPKLKKTSRLFICCAHMTCTGQYLVTLPFTSMIAFIPWSMASRSMWRHWGVCLAWFHFFFDIFFSLSSPKSPKRIEIGTCSCTQNVHLEILFPAVINFLSFHCKKLVKMTSKACYPDSISYFSSSTAKSDFSFSNFNSMYLLN